MKRMCGVVVMLAGLTLSGVPANAQSMGAGTGAPRDTARAGIRFIYLIRHGWYDGADPRDERVGKGLDSLGRAQAKLVGERLAHLPIHVDLLVSSTFTRARETADIIGESLHMSPVRDSAISECTAPSYRTDLREDFPGEHDSCQAQLERAWARYVIPAGGRDDRHDVLVCHGNVIRWLVTRAIGLSTTRWPDFDIANGSITAIVVRPDGTTRLATFSDTGHIPASAQTWTGRGAGWSPPPPRLVRRNEAMNGRDSVHVRGSAPAIIAPAPAAAYDTLRHSRPKDR
jgi:serine/threonine-protein phosphatase PGAM5